MLVYHIICEYPVRLKLCITFTDHLPHILTILICIAPRQEKNRINKDGELVISSTKTRTQKFASSLPLFLLTFFVVCCKTAKGLILPFFFFRGNVEDALAKLQVHKLFFYKVV
jgi:hypothetical protein